MLNLPLLMASQQGSHRGPAVTEAAILEQSTQAIVQATPIGSRTAGHTYTLNRLPSQSPYTVISGSVTVCQSTGRIPGRPVVDGSR